MPTQNIIEFVIYVIPGFIAILVYRFKYPAKEKDTFTEISYCILSGLLIMTVFRWVDKNLFNFFFRTNFPENPGLRFVVGTVLFGVLGGLLAIVQVKLRVWLARKYKVFSMIARSPNTIWQDVNNSYQKNWAVVFLEDESIYLGWIKKYLYDPNKAEQEFLLSNAARVDEKLNTIYEIDGVGVWLTTKNVTKIEFIKGRSKNKPAPKSD